MQYKNVNSRLDGVFKLQISEPSHDWDACNEEGLIHIIWNNSASTVNMVVDDQPVSLKRDQIITTTHYHKVRVDDAEGLTIFSFNKQYYCVHTHDAEVSCNGVIFFGAQQLAVIDVDEALREKLNLLLKVFEDEFQTEDNVQGEMLLMLLKRLIILTTRQARLQSSIQSLREDQAELVRSFRTLVDQHFRSRKTVQEYAELLFKSPKTIANVFTKIGDQTPLQIIHERIVLEARRLLTYTDKNINEIAFDLGFEETASFFKLFRKRMGVTPQKFREMSQKGKMDSSAGTLNVR